MGTDWTGKAMNNFKWIQNPSVQLEFLFATELIATKWVPFLRSFLLMMQTTNMQIVPTLLMVEQKLLTLGKLYQSLANNYQNEFIFCPNPIQSLPVLRACLGCLIRMLVCCPSCCLHSSAASTSSFPLSYPKVTEDPLLFLHCSSKYPWETDQHVPSFRNCWQKPSWREEGVQKDYR